MLPLTPSIDCPRPLAPTLTDLRLLYAAMSGKPLPRAAPEPRTNAHRLGVPDGYFREHAHPQTLAVVDETARIFR